MSIRVALNHNTHYRFDQPVGLSPHEVRLRPAPHCRTPILGYSLKVRPAKHFINWQQDPYGNYVARLVFPEKATDLAVLVDLVADMTIINPFDFFVETYAETFPFSYPAQLANELGPFLEPEPPGDLSYGWLAQFKASHHSWTEYPITDLLVALNKRVHQTVDYIVRLEAGIQTCEQTLTLRRGSCRDSGWLLVQILRNLGLAARFVSGYLIQLVPDVKPLDGPTGPKQDLTDLHAWAEVVYSQEPAGSGWTRPQASWPAKGTSRWRARLLPPAPPRSLVSPTPVNPRWTSPCRSRGFTKIRGSPSPTPKTQWQAIEALGHQVDTDLQTGDVRLTMGGEPTFVSIDDMDGDEWKTAAFGPTKRKLAGNLLTRLKNRFAPGALLHYGARQVVSRRALAALGAGVLLALGWTADLA